MNNFFTILVIPEKTKQVRKFIIPAIYVRIGIILGSVALIFLGFMIYDYVNVMQQLSENKRLQTENRQLKQQMQTFTTKLQNVQDALDRIQTYTAKLRIITNQAGDDTDFLKKKVGTEIPGIPMDDHSESPNVPHHGSSLSPEEMQNLLERVDRWKKIPHPLLADNSQNLSDVMRLAEEENQAQKKKLEDFVREDDEKESSALREDFNKLDKAFESVLQHAMTVELDVQALSSAILDQKDYLASMPTLKPTTGWYTSGFSVRASPFTGKMIMHEGLDIANQLGSAIVAPGTGVVTYAGPRPGYGNLVTIDHGYGIQTQFGHISKFFVHSGQKVKRGTKIAAVGNTGRSTGPHVHYEVRVKGIPVDPQFYILEE